MSDLLAQRLLRRIARGIDAPLDDAEFDELARAVFAYQFGCNAPYRAFCERRGATPGTVGDWTRIPAVPTDAFRSVPLVCEGAAPARVFRTSGTTRGLQSRGEHHFPNLALYDVALRAAFAAHLLPDGARLPILCLVPSPGEVPDSSLSYMAGEAVRDFGAPGSGFFVDVTGVDVDALVVALRSAQAADEPRLLFGTAFALVHLLDALRNGGEQIHLPPSSRVMETGGFKGRSREVSRAELYADLMQWLGIAAAWCVSEYGMTEMSSQFYDAVAGAGDPDVAARLHRGPPWVRTRAVDPETLQILPDGETGVLRHWDLANLHSVAAIQTADLGWTAPKGFRLLGRATGAEARGCSLATEELLAALGG